MSPFSLPPFISGPQYLKSVSAMILKSGQWFTFKKEGRIQFYLLTRVVGTYAHFVEITLSYTLIICMLFLQACCNGVLKLACGGL